MKRPGSQRAGWAGIAPVVVFALVLPVHRPILALEAGEPRDLSLAEALEFADADGESIRVAEAGWREAEASRRAARADFAPRFDSRLGYTRTLASEFQDLDLSFGGGEESGLGDLPFGQENRWDAAVTAAQTLYAGGRLRAGLAAAAARSRAAAVGVDAERAAVRLGTVADYFDAALADRLLAISEASLLQAEKALDQARLAHSLGDAAEFDLLRAQVARDNERPVVVERRSRRNLAHLKLRQSLGMPLDQALRLTSVAPEAEPYAANPLTVESQPSTIVALAESRAPLRQAAAVVEVRRQLGLAARGESRPGLTLNSEYGRVAYPDSGVPRWRDTRDNWTVTLGAAMPLFTGGRLRAQREAADARLEAARQDLERLRELAILEATQAVERLSAAGELWEAARGSVEQASRAYDIAVVRYREGISTQLELDDSRLLLEQAEANRAVAARDLQVARALLALLPDLPLGIVDSTPALSTYFFSTSNRSGGRR